MGGQRSGFGGGGWEDRRWIGSIKETEGRARIFIDMKRKKKRGEHPLFVFQCAESKPQLKAIYISVKNVPTI